MKNQAEILKDAVCCRFWALAFGLSRRLGKRCSHFVRLRAPRPPNRIHDHGDEQHPFSLTVSLCVEVGTLEILVSTRAVRLSVADLLRTSRRRPLVTAKSKQAGTPLRHLGT